MKNRRKFGDLSTKEKILGVFMWTIICLVIFFGITALFSDKKTEGNKKRTESISMAKAEEYCQDAALLEKYLDMDKVDVIDTLNYNARFDEYTSNDSNGKPLMMLNWNGKVNDKTTPFMCVVGGTNDSVQLHKLTVDGKELYNTVKDEQ